MTEHVVELGTPFDRVKRIVLGDNISHAASIVSAADGHARFDQRLGIDLAVQLDVAKLAKARERRDKHALT
jgi:hypothetical protein